MNWNKRIRQIHRWLSVILTLAVIINVIALIQHWNAGWVGALAFVPLMFMMLTGWYLFALPYIDKRRRKS